MQVVAVAGDSWRIAMFYLVRNGPSDRDLPKSAVNYTLSENRINDLSMPKLSCLVATLFPGFVFLLDYFSSYCGHFFLLCDLEVCSPF